MAMSRPKGSKNKPKVPVENTIQSPTEDVVVNVSAVETPIVETKKKRERKEYLPENPDWVLTTTIYKTPIAIEGICKVCNGYQFIVIPNYKERTSKTTVDSMDVIKPIFDNPEQEKEFENIPFGIRVVEKQVEIITQTPETIPADDTLNDVGIETK
jgi:hypothetical protein